MLVWLYDPRLRPLALRPSPAWLWSLDATQVLWANPTGAAIFGAPTPAALSVRSFERTRHAAAEVARIADTLRSDGAVRLERLRGFGAAMGRPLTCACSRITLADGATGVLIAAVERAGPDLSLAERVARLLAANVEPVAVFDEDGALIGATPSARQSIHENISFDAIGEIIQIDRIQIDRIQEPAVWVATLRKNSVSPALEQPVPSIAAAPDDTPLAVQPELFPELPPPPPPLASPAAMEEHRRPLRFVWQMDQEGRFAIDSAEFLEIMGPRTAALIGQPWPFIASVTHLDPAAEVARAIATRATWSGVSVAWRVDGSNERLAVELSGLPVFDRERAYRGYRGFGVCRDVAHLNAIARERHGAAAEVLPVVTAPPTITSSDVRPEDAPGLTPVERYAFNELSRQLTQRINEADARAQLAANTNVPPAAQGVSATDGPRDTEPAIADQTRPFLDRLPIGVLVYRLSDLLYANKPFLDWTGSDSLDALAEAGGLDSLMIESGDIAIEEGGRKAFSIASLNDENNVAEARLLQVPWDGELAFALLTMPPSENAATRALLDAARARARGR